MNGFSAHMTYSEGSAAVVTDAVATQEDDALFVFQANSTRGGVLHLLNLELKSFDFFFTQSGDFLGNVHGIFRNVLAYNEQTNARGHTSLSLVSTFNNVVRGRWKGLEKHWLVVTGDVVGGGEHFK